jgi:tRNA threonylcarbamoyl adenosine modification protein YjeE
MPMISKSLEETRKIAQDFAQKLAPSSEKATVVALSGDLGSGKTTFTKAFAESFGIDEKEVLSPTFVIMKSYNIDKKTSSLKKLIHIDAYRLESADEIKKLGWQKILADQNNLILIEWPENIGNAIPNDAKKIKFKFIDENTREII